MCDKNKLKAELQGVESVLAELKDQHDRGKIDIGRYLALKKEYETSKAELEQELAQAYCFQGVDHLNQHNYEWAIVNCDEALKLDPNCADAYGCRGIAYHRQNNNERAIADYDKAIKLGINSAPTCLFRGTAHFSQGDYEQAIADYSKAIELDLVLAYNSRGYIYHYQGNYEQAIADYQRYLELEPDASDREEIEGRILTLQSLLNP